MPIDNAILKMKLNAALDTLRKESKENLQKRINKMNVDELRKNLKEFDAAKIKSMVPDANALKAKISEADLKKLQEAAGTEYKDLYDQAVKLFREI
ncbi:MAG: hypothetical protein IKC38_04860 [Clostridia bacterium]|nr:hypothetical protein [Clostridia bacterium]